MVGKQNRLFNYLLKNTNLLKENFRGKKLNLNVIEIKEGKKVNNADKISKVRMDNIKNTDNFIYFL